MDYPIVNPIFSAAGFFDCKRSWVWTTVMGKPVVSPVSPGAGVCDPEAAGFGQKRYGYPIVNPISPGASVCHYKTGCPEQPYWLPHC
jgi:hypothetical protein